MPDRLEKLKKLEAKLALALEDAETKELASIARQYRETLREIEELQGADNNDEITKILSERDTDGKPGAVR